MAQTYPDLSLGKTYAALAYYPANRDPIDTELSAADAEYDALSGARPRGNGLA